MNIFQQKTYVVSAILSFFIVSSTYARTIVSEVHATTGNSLGTVSFEDSKYGLLIKPELSGLPVGLHGFHIHQHPDCGDHGMKAGGHFDPGATNSHQGPYGEGHLGDLPVLATNSNGEANIPLLAPRLTTKDIKGRAIMIHAGGDNYSDNPPLGGGGARIGCGKIPS
ncbi:superoxide dismutase [Legionella jordanis]|uniref:Superoxide dismutase [Cu-Zn] n=1 Tax=Legionella jordanis TaxID=456 RepID=A0A0W0V9Z5_9GAMM|nr:superoxide dismutase, Cu, Zn [Legionella jordanis]RMX03124.1 superoxide dismutase [Legionella jordanis]RMX18737.1 superoxide dismutase [Legionella jordanis]VEH12823.1 superoxide dismutase, Cu, Zn [Legionella jordanis]HAT8713034.1 superoxide dismutase [Legionella jordanis]